MNAFNPLKDLSEEELASLERLGLKGSDSIHSGPLKYIANLEIRVKTLEDFKYIKKSDRTENPESLTRKLKACKIYSLSKDEAVGDPDYEGMARLILDHVNQVIDHLVTHSELHQYSGDLVKRKIKESL